MLSQMGSRGSVVITIMTLTSLAACQPEAETHAPEVRPVRTVTVEKRDLGEAVTYTGRIQAENEIRLSFRIPGRMIERSVNVGDHIEAGQVIAKLEPQDELNAMRSAQAALAAAQAQFNQYKSNFDRQKTLLERNAASYQAFEQTEQAQDTARAQVTSAEAQLKAARDRVSYTELSSDFSGTVIATGADSGEVVQAGQIVVWVARQEGRDAVFDVPAQLLRSASHDPSVTVSLTDDPTITTVGRVREISPQADPVTRTFEVRVGLTNPPDTMRLGSTVVGRLKLDAEPLIEVPATALTDFDGRPAVWIVDPNKLTVSLRNVKILRQTATTVAISNGLDSGEMVVTAGVQALHPGQRTRLLEASR
jgi:membrane fusion protein, multidrug efflux system